MEQQPTMRCIPELELYIMISTWQVARRGALATLTIFLSITAGRDALSGKSAMVLIFILRPAILCWTVLLRKTTIAAFP